MARYAHMVGVFKELGWSVEETDTGLAVIAGPVDRESNKGYVRIDTPVGPMDDRGNMLRDTGRALADQLLLTTWNTVGKMEKEAKAEKEKSAIILPFPVPVTNPGGVA